ncbi:MAG: hypothetical protein IIT65_09840 [Lachnospiraceae bacterium]|nr:hypothetical protein [Lachnospiraceae bacterium]
MTKEQFDSLSNEMQEKLGKENTALIADSLATLVTDNIAVNDTLAKKDAEIEKLKNEKESLIHTNGQLLQKISVGTEEKRKEETKEEAKEFSFKSAFDSKGRFI